MAQIEAFGVIYNAADVKINMLGRTIIGVSKLHYGSKQEKKNIMGMGAEPIARGHGQREYEASITLKAVEVDAIQKAAPDGDISRVKPFDIVIAYMDVEENLIKTDILKFAEFTGEKRELKGGETDLESELTLVIGGIQRNV